MEILLFIIMIPFIMSSILLGVVIWALYHLVQSHHDYEETNRRGYSNDD